MCVSVDDDDHEAWGQDGFPVNNVGMSPQTCIVCQHHVSIIHLSFGGSGCERVSSARHSQAGPLIQPLIPISLFFSFGLFVAVLEWRVTPQQLKAWK